jgi:hypothetical protein
MKLAEEYRAVGEILVKFWRAYGGFSVFIRSPYLHLAIVFALMSYAQWDREWWELVISILPGLIGFTLGGYAILIAFGDEQFRALLTGASKAGRTSPFVTISATFTHFILTQVTSLLFAIITREICAPDSANSRSHPNGECAVQFVGDEYLSRLVAFVGLAPFFYSLALAISATFAIFQISFWYDMSKGDDTS